MGDEGEGGADGCIRQSSPQEACLPLQQEQDAGVSGLLRRHRVQHEVRRPEQSRHGQMDQRPQQRDGDLHLRPRRRDDHDELSPQCK